MTIITQSCCQASIHVTWSSLFFLFSYLSLLNVLPCFYCTNKTIHKYNSQKKCVGTSAGLGLKSVACIMLLCLRMREFPVDVNVGRICSRLGWIPLDVETAAEVTVLSYPFPVIVCTLYALLVVGLLCIATLAIASTRAGMQGLKTKVLPCKKKGVAGGGEGPGRLVGSATRVLMLSFGCVTLYMRPHMHNCSQHLGCLTCFQQANPILACLSSCLYSFASWSMCRNQTMATSLQADHLMRSSSPRGTKSP